MSEKNLQDLALDLAFVLHDLNKPGYTAWVLEQFLRSAKDDETRERALEFYLKEAKEKKAA